MDKSTSSSNVFTQNIETSTNNQDLLPTQRLKRPKLIRLTNEDPIPPKREKTNPDNGSSYTNHDPSNN